MMRDLSVLALVVSAVASTAAGAQSVERKGGPEKGTWAAEASVGGGFGAESGSSASLIRFVSPSTAIVGGLSFSRLSFGSEVIDSSSFITRGGVTNVSLRAGLRTYTRTGLGLRPLYGGGLLFSRTAVHGVSSSNNLGAYGEGGAAWFFNPNVSLGVTGGVSAVKLEPGWSVGATLARLTGAVYF